MNKTQFNQFDNLLINWFLAKINESQAIISTLGKPLSASNQPIACLVCNKHLLLSLTSIWTMDSRKITISIMKHVATARQSRYSTAAYQTIVTFPIAHSWISDLKSLLTESIQLNRDLHGLRCLLCCHFSFRLTLDNNVPLTKLINSLWLICCCSTRPPGISRVSHHIWRYQLVQILKRRSRKWK